MLVGAKHAALLEQTVNKGGLAVVNVGDNGYVTEGFIVLHGFLPLKKHWVVRFCSPPRGDSDWQLGCGR